MAGFAERLSKHLTQRTDGRVNERRRTPVLWSEFRLTFEPWLHSKASYSATGEFGIILSNDSAASDDEGQLLHGELAFFKRDIVPDLSPGCIERALCPSPVGRIV